MIDRVTVDQDFDIFTHLIGNFIITLSQLDIFAVVQSVLSQKFEGLSSPVSVPDVFNSTGFIQKNSSNFELQGVNPSASSEYSGEKLEGVAVSVYVIVKVLNFGHIASQYE